MKILNNTHFNGSNYVPELDRRRLVGQLLRVYELMSDNQWRTLDEISNKTKDPHASISAQLRNLRKERFGSYIIDKRRRGEGTSGLWEYKLIITNE